MDLKDHARYALTSQRFFTEQILEGFKSRDQWLYQSHPQANHAMWIVGHLGLAGNHFASMFRPEAADVPAGWEELFWFGSELKSNTSLYPAHEEALAYFRDRHNTLLKVLEDVSEEELNASAPAAGEPSPIAGAPCQGHAFLFAARHEAMHAGQLSIAHRGIGHAPLFSPETEVQETGA